MTPAKQVKPKTISIKQLFRELDKEKEEVKFFRMRDREIEKKQIDQIVKNSGIYLERNY